MKFLNLFWRKRPCFFTKSFDIVKIGFKNIIILLTLFFRQIETIERAQFFVYLWNDLKICFQNQHKITYYGKRKDFKESKKSWITPRHVFRIFFLILTLRGQARVQILGTNFREDNQVKQECFPNILKVCRLIYENRHSKRK